VSTDGSYGPSDLKRHRTSIEQIINIEPLHLAGIRA